MRYMIVKTATFDVERMTWKKREDWFDGRSSRL